ncbi:MAG: YdcF family protein [Oscillospiraceae bacterium]|nr:YdcF family protein [Oscillospiraceae bacterium]
MDIQTDENSINIKANKTKGRSLALFFCIASSLLCILCFILMLVGYPAMNIAFVLTLGITGLLWVYRLLSILRQRDKFKRFANFIYRCYMIGIILSVGCFIFLQIMIMSAARSEDAQADIVIVLGAGIHGETPSAVLLTRLDAALEYAKSREKTPIIIVTGGQGQGESITEAEAMFRYLRLHDIAEDKIWKEDKSTTTLENLAFSFALIEDKDLDKEHLTIAIVTNEFHLYRAKHIAESFGYNVIGVAAKTPYISLRILYHFREAAAIIWQYLFK